MISRDSLIEIVMRETTDKIVADGWDVLGTPNILIQGCKYARRTVRTNPTEGYAEPEDAARKFAGFIADAILAAAAWRPMDSAPKDGNEFLARMHDGRNPPNPFCAIVRWNSHGGGEGAWMDRSGFEYHEDAEEKGYARPLGWRHLPDCAA